jgi:two-component system cell cycle response regulator DivK
VSTPATVLLVDDDLDLREAAAEALEDAGYRVVRADDGRRALDEMTRGGLRPDLILLDMMMPNLDGWGFRVAQRQVPAIAGIPVVALTAYALTDDERDQLDAAAILRKPVALEELMQAVESASRSAAEPRA